MNQPNDEFSYENILRSKKGLLDLKIKVSVRDSECLSMVYTPGVATPCLDIQKDITRAYEFTNKGNAIIILTDSSKFYKEKGGKWNNNAAMPYLEAFSAYYKTVANIDGYPFILDTKLIPDAETLVDTINAISPSYSGVELFMIDDDKMKKYDEIFNKSDYKGKYAYLDSSCKKELDELLKKKNTELKSHSIFACVWRAALDAHCANNLKEIVTFLKGEIESDKLDLTKGNAFTTDLHTVLARAVDYILFNKLENRELDKYNWRGEPLSKEYIMKKFKAFQTFGTRAWREEMPKGYFMHEHKNPENANVLHYRNRGVVEVGLKIAIASPFILNRLLSWENIEKISEIIVKKPEEVYEITCKSNYGAIVTNGTAILGLGNIGALAGMPVMEGKSVLFKYFGGTNIAPICIQEWDNDKLIKYIQRIAPSFCIINLEDIKGPDCFNIETKLIDLVDCPMFHDDQHGTAVVVLAGLINATKLKGAKPEELKIVMNGAGAAGISVCRLLMAYGYKNFIVCDTAGAIYKGRPNNMNPFKEILANETNPNLEKGKLSDVIKGADVVIGLSGPNTISIENVKSMNAKPIVFALANPTPEIFPKDAFEAGAYIVATGRSDFPNQINNSVAFPGIFRGTIDTRAPKITMEMKIAAAKAIADLVTPDKLRTDYIMPNALDVSTSIHVTLEVARAVVEHKLTSKKNINLDKVRENIHSLFIDESLAGIDN